MLRKMYGILTLLTLAVSLAEAADMHSAQSGLSAAQVVEKNVAARGGLQAWRAVRTLSLEGKMGVGGNQRATLSVPAPPQKPGRKAALQTLQQIYSHRPKDEVELPFRMELARTHKVRFEL